MEGYQTSFGAYDFNSSINSAPENLYYDYSSLQTNTERQPKTLNQALTNIPFLVGRFWSTHPSKVLRILHYFTFIPIRFGLIVCIIYLPAILLFQFAVSSRTFFWAGISCAFSSLIYSMFWYFRCRSKFLIPIMILYELIMLISGFLFVIFSLEYYTWWSTFLVGFATFLFFGFIQYVILHKACTGHFPPSLGPEFIPFWVDAVTRVWFGVYLVSLTFLYSSGVFVPESDCLFAKQVMEQYKASLQLKPHRISTSYQTQYQTHSF